MESYYRTHKSRQERGGIGEWENRKKGRKERYWVADTSMQVETLSAW